MTSSLVDRAQAMADRARADNPQPESPSQMRAALGIEYSRAGAGEDWHADALKVVHRFAELNPYVHVDELWPFLPPADNAGRALGSVMQTAASNGWIRKATPAGDWPHGAVVCQPSRLSNGSPKPLWLSNLYPHSDRNQLIRPVAELDTARERIAELETALRMLLADYERLESAHDRCRCDSVADDHN